MFEPFQILSI
ncbi:BM2 protein, partial [Influenza B virus (B/New York/WC-LVD-15-024/2015)]